MRRDRYHALKNMHFSQAGFSPEEAVALAPTLGAMVPHESRGRNYGMVPTLAIMQGMVKHGFQLHSISTPKVRDVSKVGFEKHMLRFRHVEALSDDTVNEVIVLNSHDGSTCFDMRSGMYRFVCSNSLVCGDDIARVKIKHSGNIIQDVIAGANHVVSRFNEVTQSRNEMREIQLHRDEQEVLAAAALRIRFAVDHEQDAPITIDQLLRPRRNADAGRDLWRTFNVIQENCTKGGLHGVTTDAETGRRRRMTTRDVNGIAQNLHVNQTLHMLASRMADLKLKREPREPAPMAMAA